MAIFCAPKKSLYQTARKAHQHGRIPIKRCCAKMLVNFMEAIQHGSNYS